MSRAGHELPDMSSGDLVIIIRREKHKIFERIGADLAMNKELTLREALCGYDLRIPHLSGKILRLKSKKKEVVQPNDLKVIYGQGILLFFCLRSLSLSLFACLSASETNEHVFLCVLK